MQNITKNILQIQEILPQDVTMIAVSKTKPVELIKEAYSAGVRDFGENKVQELINKIEYFKNEKDINWHFIGHLQRNKVKYIVGKVKLIHSLDSIRLLDEIEKKYKQENIKAKVLIQINIGKEDSKTGIYKEHLEEMLLAIEKCKNVEALGIMAIIPKGTEKECRCYFKQMKKLFETLKLRSFKNIQMKYLSMGMSGDYTLAIEEGSNMIRIGRNIFGERTYKNKEEF